jgi:hypothetical protein
MKFFSLSFPLGTDLNSSCIVTVFQNKVNEFLFVKPISNELTKHVADNITRSMITKIFSLLLQPSSQMSLVGCKRKEQFDNAETPKKISKLVSEMNESNRVTNTKVFVLICFLNCRFIYSSCVCILFNLICL